MEKLTRLLLGLILLLSIGAGAQVDVFPKVGACLAASGYLHIDKVTGVHSCDHPRAIPDLSGWWRQGVGITSSAERVSQWDDQSGNARHLLQGTGANQPIVLPWSGVNYYWNPGVASNTISSPSKTVTGNLTITLDFALDSWTPGANIQPFGKLSGNDGFQVTWLTTGKPRFQVGDGVSVTAADAASGPGWTNQSRHTLRIVWQDGVGATFFYDGAQSGSQVAAAKTLTNAAASLSIGPAAQTAAKWYSLSITDGASTTYYSVDFTQVAEGTTSFTQNGDTYTVNTSGAKQAQIIGSPQIVGDGAAYFMRASYTQAQPVTRFFLFKPVVWTSGSCLSDGGGGGALAAAVYDRTATPNMGVNAGGTPLDNGAASLGAYHAAAIVFNGSSGTFQVDSTVTGPVNVGSATTAGLTVFGNGAATAAGFGAHQVKEIIEYNRALSQAEINSVMRYLSKNGNLGLSIAETDYYPLFAANDEMYRIAVNQ